METPEKPRIFLNGFMKSERVQKYFTMEMVFDSWGSLKQRGKNNLTQTLLDPAENSYYLKQILGMDGKLLYPEVATSPLESKTLWSGYITGPLLSCVLTTVESTRSPLLTSIPSPNFLVMSGNAALLVIAFVVKLYAFRLDNNSKNLAIINFKNNYLSLGFLNGWKHS